MTLLVKKIKIKIGNYFFSFIIKIFVYGSGKKLNKGTVIGGILFGIGWAITGACPGPIFAQIGTGEYAAISTLAGAIMGSWSYNFLKSKLPL